MTTETARDVMQVCMAGHVITDVLASHPGQGAHHCDRCGAPTLNRCPTCGEDIPGAANLPGLMTIGQRQAPQHCPNCGAAFPWAGIPNAPPADDQLALLETILRRLPRAIRQLRDRHGQRPTLRVDDDHDLADLLRAVLYLHFDDVRRVNRTPKYSAGTRTDFVVGTDRIAVAAKLATPGVGERQLAHELEEDVAHYEGQPDCERLVVLICDLEQVLHNPRQIEAAWSRAAGGFDVQCIVGS